MTPTLHHSESIIVNVLTTEGMKSARMTPPPPPNPSVTKAPAWGAKGTFAAVPKQRPQPAAAVPQPAPTPLTSSDPKSRLLPSKSTMLTRSEETPTAGRLQVTVRPAFPPGLCYLLACIPPQTGLWTEASEELITRAWTRLIGAITDPSAKSTLARSVHLRTARYRAQTGTERSATRQILQLWSSATESESFSLLAHLRQLHGRTEWFNTLCYQWVVSDSSDLTTPHFDDVKMSAPKYAMLDSFPVVKKCWVRIDRTSKPIAPLHLLEIIQAFYAMFDTEPPEIIDVYGLQTQVLAAYTSFVIHTSSHSAMSRIALDITPGHELHDILKVNVMSTTGLTPAVLQPRGPPPRLYEAPPEPVQREPAQHQPPPQAGLTHVDRSCSMPKRQRSGKEASTTEKSIMVISGGEDPPNMNEEGPKRVEKQMTTRNRLR
jgi:hypothetical protein